MTDFEISKHRMSEIAPDNYNVVCNHCANRTARLLFVKNTYQILKCRSCDLVFVYPIPDHSVIGGLYSEKYFTDGRREGSPIGHLDEDSGKRITWQHKLTEIAELCSTGRLLDVGAGPGYFVKLARQNGWDAEGLDISTFAAEYGCHQLGVKIQATPFLEFEPPTLYDAITMWDFIEHTQDPFANLRKAYNLLKPGGVLVLSTGDVGSALARLMGRRWYMFSPPLHLYYFSKATLTDLLSKVGFVPQKIAYEPRTMSLKYATARASLLYPNNRMLSSLMKLIRSSPIGKLKLTFNSRDVMVIYARKPNTC